MWSHHFIFKKTKILFYVLLFLLNHLKYFVTGWVPQQAKIRMQGVYWVLLPPTAVGVKSWALYASAHLTRVLKLEWSFRAVKRGTDLYILPSVSENRQLVKWYDLEWSGCLHQSSHMGRYLLPTSFTSGN